MKTDMMSININSLSSDALSQLEKMFYYHHDMKKSNECGQRELDVTMAMEDRSIAIDYTTEHIIEIDINVLNSDELFQLMKIFYRLHEEEKTTKVFNRALEIA